jgi:hypothetical protein
MPRVLITEAPNEGTERTWRRPVAERIALAICLGVLTTLPGLWLALTLVTNQVSNGGWIALALALLVWALLAWRALVQSVILTPSLTRITSHTRTDPLVPAGGPPGRAVRYSSIPG